MSDKQAQARAYLGIPDDNPMVVRDEIVDAVTRPIVIDDVPASIQESPEWQKATDHDKREIARFAMLVRAVRLTP